METTFGLFISRKREEKGISLRKTAKALGISPAYMCDVEHDRRGPFSYETLLTLSNLLGFSKEETMTMMDLAGNAKNTIPPDIEVFLMAHHEWYDTIRKAIRKEELQ